MSFICATYTELSFLFTEEFRGCDSINLKKKKISKQVMEMVHEL